VASGERRLWAYFVEKVENLRWQIFRQEHLFVKSQVRTVVTAPDTRYQLQGDDLADPLDKILQH